MKAGRVLVLTERGNCLFDSTDSVEAAEGCVGTKDLCRLIASLGTLTELDDFRLMEISAACQCVSRTQVHTLRRGEVLWSYLSPAAVPTPAFRLILLKVRPIQLFVTFLRNCPTLEQILDTERTETHRVPLTQSMNFTYRSTTSEISVVEVQRLPQYRQFLTSLEGIESRFEAAFCAFRGCVFGYSDRPLAVFGQWNEGNSYIEPMVRKLQEDCASELAVHFK